MIGADMSATLTGIALNLVALVLFVTMDTTGKLLVAHYPVGQVVFLRFCFHVVFVALAIRLLTGTLPWRSRAPRLQLLRGLCLIASSLFFVGALAFIPLADATAVGFASPLLTVVLAAVWLRETVGWRRWLGVAVGLLGVLVALRPPFLTGGAAPHWAIVLPLCNAVVYSVYQILTRRLAAIDDPRTTILYTGLAGPAVLALAQPFIWQWPGAVGPYSAGWVWLALVALGALGAAGHGLLVLAFTRVPASLLAPVMYSQLLWALIASAVVFGQRPDGITLSGAAIIACGGLLVAWPADGWRGRRA
jgi:drug/metabolite transporter (DMT)-like permease